MADQPIVTPDDQAELEARARTVALRNQVPPPVENMAYGPDGKLTRAGMEAIIDSGGSVMYGTSILWRKQDLPNEAQLAQGDKVKAQQAATTIQAQIDALNAQLASLSNPPADAHQGHMAQLNTSQPDLPAGVAFGTLGEGDTAGLDGDRSDPESLAGKKAAAEQAAAEQAAQDQADQQAALDQQLAGGGSDSGKTKPSDKGNK